MICVISGQGVLTSGKAGRDWTCSVLQWGELFSLCLLQDVLVLIFSVFDHSLLLRSSFILHPGLSYLLWLIFWLFLNKWSLEKTRLAFRPSAVLCHPFLLLLLSCFSRVRLCATPYTAAHQVPPSLGFSRQEHWSRLPFSSPVHESEKWKWSPSVDWFFATPWTVAYQSPPSMGFPRQEYWSGVPLPSP